MAAGNMLYVTGAMWSPALAAFATKGIFGESIRELPWKWGNARYAWLGYAIPILYTVPVYVIVWLSGLGAFNVAFLQKTAAEFGWKNFPPSITLTLFVLITATIGLIPKLSRALGEEIGWRGFLVPELAKVVSFPKVALISGLMWAAYHYPVLLFADYNGGGPRWYSLICFTVMVVAGSFILAWLVLRAQSLWPAAIFHASHNLFVQSICTPLTRDTGQRVALWLGFDRPDGFAVDKQKIVDFVAVFEKRLSNRDPSARRQINRVAVLQNPAALL